MRTTGDRTGEEEVLNDIGLIHSVLGQSQVALGYYSESLVIARATVNTTREAHILANMAVVFTDIGKNQKELERPSEWPEA